MDGSEGMSSEWKPIFAGQNGGWNANNDEDMGIVQYGRLDMVDNKHRHHYRNRQCEESTIRTSRSRIKWTNTLKLPGDESEETRRS